MTSLNLFPITTEPWCLKDTMASTPKPLSIIVVMKIKADKLTRAEELWHEQINYLDTSEFAGKVKYSLWLNDEVEREFVVVQEYVSLISFQAAECSVRNGSLFD